MKKETETGDGKKTRSDGGDPRSEVRNQTAALLSVGARRAVPRLTEPREARENKRMTSLQSPHTASILNLHPEPAFPAHCALRTAHFFLTPFLFLDIPTANGI